MFYCYVEGNTVVEGPRTLPKGWKNISGMHHLSPEELAAIGWLPVTGDVPFYDEATQKLGQLQYAISQTEPEVVKVWPVIDMTPEEVEAKALSVWLAEIADSDTRHMDRALEEHIEFDHNGIVSSPDLQTRYNSKKAIRAKHPGGS